MLINKKFRENKISVRRINILFCSMGIAACMLTGCGKSMPELTEEENTIITEYAVNVLLKYDKNYSSRLMDLEAYEEAKAKKEEIAAIEEAIAKEEAAKKEQQKQDGLPVEDTDVIDISEEGAEEMAAQTIEEFYTIDGFTFQYMGYEQILEYPETIEGETDAFFAMEATEGTQLLVIKYQALNQSGAEKELNMLNYGIKARVVVNEESPRNLLTTMLLNDLQTYQGIVGANESVELVGIIEVPENISVSKLSIILKNESDSVTIPLQ